MNIEQIALTIVKIIAPFAPFLIEFGVEGSKKLGEVIATKGGETAWERAKSLWESIKMRYGKDNEVNGAVSLLAAQPERESYQALLVEVLSERMKNDSKFTDEILGVLGGQEAFQRNIATNDSSISQVIQTIEGFGIQDNQAENNSQIVDIKQSITRSRG